MDANGEKYKNQFKLIRQVEDLGPAILHLGKFTKREQKVHVKISKKKYMSKDEYKYNKEIQALNELNHRNVLKMFAAWIDEDHELRIVTEHLDTNLNRVMKRRNRPFTEMETKNVMVQVLEGLEHVHKKNFMHRNIKPEAVKCDPEAKVIKIGDFTHALALDQKQMVKLDVKPSWYLAPEILLTLAYSSPVDIWSAGCLMAELLAGKPLFEGNNDKDQLKKICEVLGTFTKAEWPLGYNEAKTGDYSLSMLQGTGLSKLNVPERSEAKPAILSMLRWVPEKRLTAEMCLQNKFFIDDSAKDDILQDTHLKIQSWTEKWEQNLDEKSIWELQNIMEGLSPRKEKNVTDMFEKRNESPPRKPMTYPEPSSSQYGGQQSSRETPRASMESSRSVALDDYLRSSRGGHAQMSESARNSPQKEMAAVHGIPQQKGSGGGGPPWMWNLEKADLMDDPFRPQRNGQRRRNDAGKLTQRSMDGMRGNPIVHSNDQEQSGRAFDELDTGQPTSRKQINETERKKLMQINRPFKYRALYGDDNVSHRSQFGQNADPGQQGFQNAAKTGNDQQKAMGNTASIGGPQGRKRTDDFHKSTYEPSWF